MSRHAERYPTISAGGRESSPPYEQYPNTGRLTPTSPGMIALLDRIKDSKVELKGDLAFVNEWEYFTQGTF